MLKIYGASDDLIEVEGDVTEEFNPHGGIQNDERDFLILSTGHVLTVDYDDHGLWRIHLRSGDTENYERWAATDPDSDQYSDVVTIHADVAWVAFASRFVPTFPGKKKR